MDNNEYLKMLNNVLKQQGIEDFRPIENKDKYFGYVKDGHFVVCDEKMKSIPQKDNYIFFSYGNNGQYVVSDIDEYKLNPHPAFIVNNKGRILGCGKIFEFRDNGNIIIGEKLSVDDGEVCVLDMSLWYPKTYLVQGKEMNGNYINDDGLIDGYWMVAETGIFDILYNKSSRECAIYEKNGSIITQCAGDIIWIHHDKSLTIIPTIVIEKNSVKIHEIDALSKNVKELVLNTFLLPEWRIRVWQEPNVQTGKIKSEFIGDDYLVVTISTLYDDFSNNIRLIQRDNHSYSFSGEIVAEEITIKNNILLAHYNIDYTEDNGPISIVKSDGFYQLPKMEQLEIKGEYGKFACYVEEHNGEKMYGVFRTTDFVKIFPAIFHNVEIIDDALFAVTIRRSVGNGEVENDIGIYNEKSIVVPIGMCDRYEYKKNTHCKLKKDMLEDVIEENGVLLTYYKNEQKHNIFVRGSIIQEVDVENERDNEENYVRK